MLTAVFLHALDTCGGKFDASEVYVHPPCCLGTGFLFPQRPLLHAGSPNLLGAGAKSIQQGGKQGQWTPAPLILHQGASDHHLWMAKGFLDGEDRRGGHAPRSR